MKYGVYDGEDGKRVEISDYRGLMERGGEDQKFVAKLDRLEDGKRFSHALNGGTGDPPIVVVKAFGNDTPVSQIDESVYVESMGHSQEYYDANYVNDPPGDYTVKDEPTHWTDADQKAYEANLAASGWSEREQESFERSAHAAAGGDPEYGHREDEKLAGIGIIEAHILPKLLEDQARIWMTASDSGYDEAAGDKALAASVMGTDIKDTRILYAGEMGAARGTFRGELIGAFDDKIYQRIGDNTVVVHKISDKLSKDRIGQAMEITCSEEKGRVLQQILEFKGDRGFALGNTAAKEQQAKQEAKQSMGMSR